LGKGGRMLGCLSVAQSSDQQTLCVVEGEVFAEFPAEARVPHQSHVPMINRSHSAQLIENVVMFTGYGSCWTGRASRRTCFPQQPYSICQSHSPSSHYRYDSWNPPVSLLYPTGPLCPPTSPEIGTTGTSVLRDFMKLPGIINPSLFTSDPATS